MTAIGATEARKRFYELLDEVSGSHEPIEITRPRSSAVLVSEEDWRRAGDAPLVSIPRMGDSTRFALDAPGVREGCRHRARRRVAASQHQPISPRPRCHGGPS